jgi:hypothetical protein
MNSFSRAKRDLDAKLGDVPGWVLHDLRRTARSLLSRAGVRRIFPNVCLGTPSGVEGVYDRHSYAAEKADALNKLASLVDALVHPPEGSNVVAMPARR